MSTQKLETIEFGDRFLIQMTPVTRVGKRDAHTPKAVEKLVPADFYAAVRDFSKGLMGTLREVMPDEATLEFGVGVQGEGKFILCSASASATVKVTLKWKSSAEEKGK